MARKPPKGELAKAVAGNLTIPGYDDKLVASDDKVLQGKGGDINIYSDLLRDDQVASTFQQRRTAVVSREWVVDAASDSSTDQAAAEFIRETLNGIKWDDVTDKMLYSVFYGYGVAELIFENQGSRIGLSAIKVRDRGRFRFGSSGSLYLRKEDGGELVKMPERKFWTITSGADNDDQPYGMGLANRLYWPVFFKRNDIKFWLTFLERYSTPTGVARMPDGQFADEKKRRDVLESLQSLAGEGQIVIPDSTKLDFLQAVGSGSTNYEEMVRIMDSAISKIVLSQTMTTDNGASLAQAKVHSDVRDEVVKADADLVCESFNRGPLRWLIDLNFPGAGYPKVWRKIEPEEDVNARAERDKHIADLGFEPTEDYIRETYGEGWVKRSTNPLRLPGSATGWPEGEDLDPTFAELSELVASRNAHRQDQQALKEAANRFAREYRGAIGEQVAALLEFLEDSDDLETFEKRLAELVSKPPSKQAVQALERGGFVARLMGRLRGA